MNSNPVEILKRQVQESFGRRILSAGDRGQLCDAVQKATAQHLNINTLRRCFGLVKTAYQPSVSTLNILSQYCGFNSYSHFQQHHQEAPAKDHAAGHLLLQYVVSLFRHTKVPEKNDTAFIGVVRQTLLFLAREPQLIAPFQRAVAPTLNGQLFYFEQCIHIDALSHHYGEGLLHYLTAKKEAEAQVFGHGLLCLRAWLQGDSAGVAAQYETVVAQGTIHNLHPYVAAQYFAVGLFRAAVQQAPIAGLLADIRSFYRSVVPGRDNQRFFPAFELVLCDALLQVGQYDEALFYINAALKKKEKSLPLYQDGKLTQAFQLFYAVALAGTGQRKEAIAAARKVNTGEFYFLRKRYYSLYFLVLKLWLQPQNAKAAAQLQFLVQKTGFTFFEQYRLPSLQRISALKQEEEKLAHPIRA